MLSGLNWVDVVILGIIALSVVGGIFKGFIKSAVSLITWVAALFLANAFYPDLAVKFGSANSTVANTLSFGIIALVVLAIGMILGMILTRIVFLSMSLTMLNTIGGALFGVLRGMVFVVLAVYIAMLTPAPKYAPWQQSKFIPYFQSWAGEVNKLVPNSFTQEINQVKNISPQQLKNIDIHQYTDKIKNMINQPK